MLNSKQGQAVLEGGEQCQSHIWTYMYLLRSEQVRLLHNAKELLLVYLSIPIPVCLINHFLKLLIRHTFAQLFGNSLEVLEANFSSLVVVKKPKCFQDLIFGISVPH